MREGDTFDELFEFGGTKRSDVERVPSVEAVVFVFFF